MSIQILTAKSDCRYIFISVYPYIGAIEWSTEMRKAANEKNYAEENK